MFLNMKDTRLKEARSRLTIHHNLEQKKGNVVIIKECRPISKTKKFIVIEVVKK